jgi:hypothetical protein
MFRFANQSAAFCKFRSFAGPTNRHNTYQS